MATKKKTNALDVAKDLYDIATRVTVKSAIGPLSDTPGPHNGPVTQKLRAFRDATAPKIKDAVHAVDKSILEDAPGVDKTKGLLGQPLSQARQDYNQRELNGLRAAYKFFRGFKQ